MIALYNPAIRKEIEKNGKKQNNINSSITAYFLQEIENQILETIYFYCIKKKYIKKSCVLCFDGIMIPIKNYKKELLNEFEELIKEKFNLNLTFVEKKLDTGYTNEEIQSSQIDDNSNYGNLKTEFEKYNFKVLNPLMFATLDDKDKLILRTRTDFKNVYENKLYIDDDDNQDKSFISKWLKDTNMRTYDRIDFLPQQKVPNSVYNTFINFKAETKELENNDISNSLIFKHIKEVVCNNNEDLINYFMKWLARMIQKPYDNKNRTAFCLKGAEGSGKDTIFNWFGNNILGREYYLNEDSIELIFGRFNSCIENKILIVLNEASGKETFSIVEKIKNSITRDVNTIENKGMKPYTNKNHISYAFITNNDNPVKISPNERRFFCNECDNSKANNAEYFTALYKEINSEIYDRAFYDYFKSLETWLNGVCKYYILIFRSFCNEHDWNDKSINWIPDKYSIFAS